MTDTQGKIARLRRELAEALREAGELVPADRMEEICRERDSAEYEARAMSRANSEPADRVAELEAEVERLRKAITQSFRGALYMDPPDGGSVALEEQIMRMGKDAERYRFVREQHEDDADCFCVFEPRLDHLAPVGSMPGELDAAIDAALAAKGEE